MNCSFMNCSILLCDRTEHMARKEQKISRRTPGSPAHAIHIYILEIGTELPLCFRTYVASGLAGWLAGYCMMMMMMMMMMAVAVAVAVAVASR